MKGFNLSEWAIKHRSFVWFLMILFVVAGVLSYRELGREEDPSFFNQDNDRADLLAGRHD
jgi:multidrug efflux pump